MLHVPVVVAGGGPVGLTTAALLERQGIACVVIEADDSYCTGSRAICISRRSLEILGWIGAASRVDDIGLSWVGGRSYFRDREVLHFRMPSEPDERFAPMVNIQQYHIEEAAALALGRSTIRWSTRVVDVHQDDTCVTIDTTDADGRPDRFTADWLVACDGGRSTVRDRLGLALEGIQYEGRYVIVDIEQETRRDVERLAWFDPPSNPGSTLLMHRQPGNVWRIDYQIRDDQDPVEAIKPDNVLPRVQSHLTMIGETAPWKPLWISIYNAKCLTLSNYRVGRVLFAGDAAHLVPIFGVRGLNSGLDDAGNLAWKLALVVEGRAPVELLDSYTDERLAAARENIAYGAKSTEFMAPPHAGFALMREAALRLALDDESVRSLINPRQSAPVAYRNSPLNHGVGGLVGTPAPEAAVDGLQFQHLTERFGRDFVVLLFSESATPLGPARFEVLRVARRGTPSPGVAIDRSGDAWRRYAATEGATFLVRPDGYVTGCWSFPDFEAIAKAVANIAPRAVIEEATS